MFCTGPYSRDNMGKRWVLCVSCLKWRHEACAGIDSDGCDHFTRDFCISDPRGIIKKKLVFKAFFTQFKILFKSKPNTFRLIIIRSPPYWSLWSAVCVVATQRTSTHPAKSKQKGANANRRVSSMHCCRSESPAQSLQVRKAHRR